MNTFIRTPVRGPDIRFAENHEKYQERQSSQPSEFELERGRLRQRIEDINEAREMRKLNDYWS